MEKMVEKIIIGVLLVLVLGVGSVLVTALVTRTNPLDSRPLERFTDTNNNELSEAEETAQLVPLAGITAEQAQAIALSVVDTKKVGSITDIELENENGNTVYAVEFTKDGIETDVKIDAVNGNVLLIEDDTNEADRDDDENERMEDDEDEDDEDDETRVSSANARITEEEAKRIAEDETGGRATEVDTDRVRGRAAFEIEIRKNGKEADVLVDMETGEVLEVEWEDEEDEDDD